MADASVQQPSSNGVHDTAQSNEEPGVKVFVGNLAHSVNDEGLKSFFAQYQSDILSIRTIPRVSKSAGYGFVALNSAEAAQRAVDLLHKKEFDGRAVVVQLANTVGGRAQATEAPDSKVFVGNLAYSVNNESLRTFFAPVEEDIVSAQVIFHGNRSAGFGFVAFKTLEVAQQAVEALDKQELDGRPVVVEIAKPAEFRDKERKDRDRRPKQRRTGRRGSKPVVGEVTEAEANGESPKAEDVQPASTDAQPKKKKKAPRKPKRKPEDAAVSTEEAPASAVVEEAAAAKKRTPKPRRTRPPRPAGEDPEGSPSKSMLFVANLSFSIDDAALTKIFTDAGINVVSTRVVRKRFGTPRKSKGFGFVDVGNEDEQKKAITALQGKELEDGRQMAVKVAVDTPREDTEDQANDEAIEA